MSDKTLRLRFVFDALERMSAPLRRMQAGSKGLATQMADTRREIAGLKKAQLQVAQFRGAEGRFQKSAAELAVLSARTAQLREEIAKVETPTKRMANALAIAEGKEASAIAKHEEHGRRLQELSRGLEAAGADVADLGAHEARLADRLEATNRQFDAQRAKMERLQKIRQRGQTIKDVGGKVAIAGAATTALVTAPIIAAGAAAYQGAKAQAAAMAQVNAALKSMGPVSGRTAAQLLKASDAMELKSLYDGDEILKKVTANMLTFGKVSGAQFDRGQQAALDMAARMETDLQSATLMVGKALNNPIKGISALSRVGIQLDESQQKAIKSMVKTGNVAGAQAIILGELEKQFGGAAKAAADNEPAREFQVTMGQIGDQIGDKVIPLMKQLGGIAVSLMNRFNALSPSAQKFLLFAVIAAAALGPVLTVLGGLIAAIGGIITIVSTLAAVLGVGLAAAAGIIGGVILAIAGLIAIGVLVYRNWGAISAFFVAVWERIKAIVGIAISAIATVIMNFTPVGLFIRGFTAVFNYLRGLVPSWASVGRMMLEGLLTALSPARLVAHVLRLGGAAITAIKGVLGIKSPSRVFAGIGGHIMDGLQLGLDRGVDGPLARIRKAGSELTGALAGSVLLAAPAAAGPAPGTGLTPPAAATARTGGNSYTINVHLPPGSNLSKEDVADAVEEAIDKRERAAGAAKRSSFRDDD